MLVRNEPAMNWMRRQRRAVDLELDMMAARFDLEGALEAGQWELVWMARQELLVAAAEIHLRGRGVEPVKGADITETTWLLLDRLAQVDAALAQRVWALLEQPAPLTEPGLRAAVDDATAFMVTTLAVPSAVSRDAAVRGWADAIKLLRSVARELGGMAQSDDWYLSDSDPGERLDWYDEVLGTLAGPSPAQG